MYLIYRYKNIQDEMAIVVQLHKDFSHLKIRFRENRH